MPMSLCSLLNTHPYKKKDCLEYLCAKLKITANGSTVDTLRQRVLEYADENKEMEEKIKEAAYHFKHREEKKNKISTPHSKVSSQSLFGSQTACSDTDDDDDEDDDDAEKLIDESFSLLFGGSENVADETTVPKIPIESQQETASPRPPSTTTTTTTTTKTKPNNKQTNK